MKIFIIGFMGSGKTYWGRLWSQQYSLPFFDLDELIAAEQKKAITAIFEMEGEAHFRQTETAILKSLAHKDDSIIACGGGTPCFNNNMQWMNENGVTVYLSASPQYIYNRVVAEKDKRPLLKDLEEGALLSFIEQKLIDRTPIYELAQIILPVKALNTDSIKGIINS